MSVYVRVKNRITGHEYDVLEHQFDPEKHKKVSERRYPPASRPRRPKPNISKGGGSARAGQPVPTDKE